MQHPKLSLLIVFAGAIGCASTAVAPLQERVDARASFAAAQRLQPYLDAERIQTRLAEAEADMQKADGLMTDREYEVARFYYERSAAASDVAIAWAKARAAEQLASNVEAEQPEQPEQPEEHSHEDVE
jgi:hypothetical protein